MKILGGKKLKLKCKCPRQSNGVRQCGWIAHKNFVDASFISALTCTGTSTGGGTDSGTDTGTDTGTDSGTDDGTDSGTDSGTDDACPASTDFTTLTDSITAGLTTCGGPSGTKIVNGVDATANSWPWIVQLGFQSTAMVESNSLSSFSCGGTILNSRFVLTAAHSCINMAQVQMSFAQHSTSSSDSNEFSIISSNWVNHDSYAPDGGTNFDVCIIDVGESIYDAATAAGADSSACWVGGWG